MADEEAVDDTPELPQIEVVREATFEPVTALDRTDSTHLTISEG